MAWGRKLEKDLRRRWNLNETLRQKKKKKAKSNATVLFTYHISLQTFSIIY